MTSVSVLCPNGRRQTMKVTANTTILQIIEEVCVKRGFESTKYDIKHGRQILDIAVTFRFSGISNNGKLELVEREIPRSSVFEITIALQLESGERRQAVIQTNLSLADMVRDFQHDAEDLLHLETERDLHPVIINMREEIVGLPALEHKTLQSIGLVSGRVALRLVYRPVEQHVLEKILQEINAEKEKMKRLIKPAANPIAAVGNIPEHFGKTATTKPTTAQGTTSMTTAAAPSVQMMAASSTTTSQQQPQTTSTVAQKDIKDEEPMEVSDAPVLEVTTPAPTNADNTTHSPPNPSHEERVASPIPSTTALRNQPASSDSQMVLRRRVEPPLPEFKFPESTAGQDLYRNDISDVDESDYLPCNRESIVYSLLDSDPSSTSLSTDSDELPDNFFDVTKRDLQMMIRHLREEVSQGEDAPLLTSSMRQARIESAYSKYEFAVIRFTFPDKMVLQGAFKPRETVHSLMKYIQSHLRDKTRNFYLYTAPPKKTLDDRAMTLIQSQLVPMTIVYVGFSNTVSEGPDSSLSEEALSLKGTRAEANIRAKQRLPSRHVDDVTTVQQATTPIRDAVATRPRPIDSSRSSTMTAASSANRSVPKWYKPKGK